MFSYTFSKTLLTRYLHPLSYPHNPCKFVTLRVVNPIFTMVPLFTPPTSSAVMCRRHILLTNVRGVQKAPFLFLFEVQFLEGWGLEGGFETRHKKKAIVGHSL